MADTPDKVAHDLINLAASTATRVRGVVIRAGMVTLTDVKRRAARSRTLPSVAGLPPRLQTGDYNRSIGMNLTSTAASYTASIGTNKVQGRRLELGFDEDGQRTLPHPHFVPALEVGGKELRSGIARVVKDIK